MADSYGPISPQGTISGLGQAGDQDGTDNNSQNLNIWTPGVNDGEKRPVMVWLHGGGFSTGSANEEERLMRIKKWIAMPSLWIRGERRMRMY